VITDDDFAAYEVPMLRKDSNIVSISATDRSVTMVYRLPAHFLGMFHSHVLTQATVGEDGTVAISHPWLSVLYDQGSETDGALRDSIQSQIGDLLNAAAPSGALTLSLKAQMLDRVHEAFEMNRDAQSGH